MDVKLKYVTKRKNKRPKADESAERWYWQRRGHPLVRLPDDPVRRFEMATRLNEAADRKAGEVMPEGSIGWVIQKYREDDAYKTLAKGTLKYYDRYLRDVEELGKTLPFAALDRRMVVDFVESYEGMGEPRKVAAVLRNLFHVAMYYGIVKQNLAEKLRLSTTKPREAFWLQPQIDAWMEAAKLHPKAPTLIVAFNVLLYTAQRPGDVLAMSWTQYNGDTIRLRQQKTGKLIEVPCHSNLRAILDEARRQADSTLIVSHDGRAVSYAAFNRDFGTLCTMAGLEDLQARDLRRTACVRMAEAGATEKQIASVTGHSIDTTRRILETYLPTNVEMARMAINKLESKK